MESRSNHSLGSGAGPWIALALCAAVFAARAVEQLVRNRGADAQTFAPDWLPLAAVGFAAAGIVRLDGWRRWPSVRQALSWIGLLLMLWIANGLPFDLLRIVGLIPLAVDWLGLATRTLALAAAAAFARVALAQPVATASVRPPTWYGYAAFGLALPYPVLRTIWALGGTLGLSYPGAAGEGFAPWLLAIPWLFAAALSLLLVSAPRWMPRQLMLVAGWTATGIVAMIGPAAFWSIVTVLIRGGDTGSQDIATWVFGLFYGSWLLWAIAAAAATRSYQVRSATPRQSSPVLSRA